MKAVSGLLPVLHTPCNADGTIDFASLEREIDWVYAHAADGCCLALASDLLRLTSDERLDLTRRVVELNRERGAVVISVGAESTAQALVYGRAAVDAGADAIMAIPPLAAALPEAELGRYYSALADEIDLPLIVQDASGYVGQAMSIAFQTSLLERYGADKVMFKPEAEPVGSNLSLLRDATAGQAHIFEGSGGIFLVDSFRRGICGTIPGSDLIDGVSALWQALKAGDEDRIYQVYLPICAIVALQMQAGLDGFLGIEHYILKQRGVFASDRVRQPCTWQPDPETLAEVDRLLDRLRAAL